MNVIAPPRAHLRNAYHLLARSALPALLLGLTVLLPARAIVDSRQPFHPLPVDAPATGLFLVAERGMLDPRFRHTVIFLLEHDSEGTLGVIINRATRVPVGEAVPYLAENAYSEYPLYFGGPVALETVMFVARGDVVPAQTTQVVEDIYHGFSRDALQRVIESDPPPRDLRFYAGYSGWSAGQLESELNRHDWRLYQADTELVFRASVDRLWEEFMDQSGRLLVEDGPVAPDRG